VLVASLPGVAVLLIRRLRPPAVDPAPRPGRVPAPAISVPRVG
jgi:hypothetical protein